MVSGHSVIGVERRGSHRIYDGTRGMDWYSYCYRVRSRCSTGIPLGIWERSDRQGDRTYCGSDSARYCAYRRVYRSVDGS